MSIYFVVILGILYAASFAWIANCIQSRKEKWFDVLLIHTFSAFMFFGGLTDFLHRLVKTGDC